VHGSSVGYKGSKHSAISSNEMANIPFNAPGTGLKSKVFTTIAND